jgi:hypothetical protein
MSPAKPTLPKKKEKKEEKALSRKGVLAIEKRKNPRLFVELPLDYSRKGKKTDFGGIVKNASEGGILVYLPEKIDVGELLKLEIYFAKGLELNTVQGVAKIVWADLAARETWREHFSTPPGFSYKSLHSFAVPATLSYIPLDLKTHGCQ